MPPPTPPRLDHADDAQRVERHRVAPSGWQRKWPGRGLRKGGNRDLLPGCGGDIGGRLRRQFKNVPTNGKIAELLENYGTMTLEALPGGKTKRRGGGGIGKFCEHEFPL